MPNGSDLVSILVTGGMGATIGSIVTAVIQVVSKRGESRATAADLVTGAAERTIIRLERENRHMREAIVLLTEVNDETLLELRRMGADEALLKKLSRTNRAAKMALSPGD